MRKRLCVERSVLDFPIEAEALILDDGVQVTITGGCRSHVGSVTAAEPDGSVRSLTFPGHKDQIVGERWAKTLAERLRRRTAVTCGIHYDGLSRENIATVVAAADTLLEQLLQTI